MSTSSYGRAAFGRNKSGRANPYRDQRINRTSHNNDAAMTSNNSVSSSLFSAPMKLLSTVGSWLQRSTSSISQNITQQYHDPSMIHYLPQPTLVEADQHQQQQNQQHQQQHQQNHQQHQQQHQQQHHQHQQHQQQHHHQQQHQQQESTHTKPINSSIDNNSRPGIAPIDTNRIENSMAQPQLTESKPPPATKWRNQYVSELTYGDLRMACRDLRVEESTDRDIMERRVIDAIAAAEISRRNFSQEAMLKKNLVKETLESAMQKKARIGFSRAEYERYLSLMRENLTDGFEAHKAEPQSVTQHSDTSRYKSTLTPRSYRYSPTPDTRLKQPFEQSKNTSIFSPNRRSSLRKVRSSYQNSSTRSFQRASDALPHRQNSGKTNAMHLSFRPQTAATRIVEPRASNQTAQSIVSTMHSLSTPLISSSSMRTRPKKLRKRDSFFTVPPAISSSIPSSSSSQPIPKSPARATPSLDDKSSPIPLTVSQRTARSPLITPTNSKAAPLPEVPVQQSTLSFKLPSVPEDSMAAHKISLAKLPVALEADTDAKVDFALLKNKDSRVERRNKRVRSDTADLDDASLATMLPVNTTSTTSSLAATSHTAPSLSSMHSSHHDDGDDDDDGTTKHSIISSSIASHTQHDDASIDADTLTTPNASAVVTEIAANSSTIETVIPPTSPHPNPSHVEPTTGEDKECSICGMGMDDVDHSDCKQEDTDSDKPSATTGFSFPSTLIKSSSMMFGTQQPENVAATPSLPSFSFGQNVVSSNETSASFDASKSLDTSSFGVPKIVAPTTESKSLSFPASSMKATPSFVIPDVPSKPTESATPSVASDAASVQASSSVFSFGASSNSANDASSSNASLSSFGNTSAKPTSASSTENAFSFGASANTKPSSIFATAPVTDAASAANKFSFGATANSFLPLSGDSKPESTVPSSLTSSIPSSSVFAFSNTPATTAISTIPSVFQSSTVSSTTGAGFTFSNPAPQLAVAPPAASMPSFGVSTNTMTSGSTSGNAFSGASAAAPSSTGFSFGQHEQPVLNSTSMTMDSAMGMSPSTSPSGVSNTSNMFGAGFSGGPAQTTPAINNFFGQAPTSVSNSVSSTFGQSVSSSVGFNFDRPAPAGAAIQGQAGFSMGAAPAPSGRKIFRAKRTR